MLIKILKGEELFSEQGTHICDERGFAIIASEDTECEVNERIEIINNLLKASRLNRGLDENGDPIPTEEPQQSVVE
jgi:hypothetical protein